MSEEEKSPSDGAWNEGWTIKRELERASLTFEFFSDFIEREHDGEIIQALSYFAMVGKEPCLQTKLNIQSSDDSTESLDLAYGTIHDEFLRLLSARLGSAIATAAKLVIESALHEVWLALYAKTRIAAGEDVEKVIDDFIDAMKKVADHQCEFWAANWRLALGDIDLGKGYRLPGLFLKHEELKPVWQAAQRHASAALKSRDPKERAKWREAVYAEGFERPREETEGFIRATG